MPHIPVVCPHCETEYRLEDNLVGKNILCPNTLCGEVFPVRHRDEAESAPPVEERSTQSDLAEEEPAAGQQETPPKPKPTEAVASDKPSEPSESLAPHETSWRDAPPARRETTESMPMRPIASDAQQESVEQTEELPDEAWGAPATGSDVAIQETDGTTVLSAGMWDAPPVRNTTESISEQFAGVDWTEDDAFAEAGEESSAEEVDVSVKKRTASWRNLAIVLVLLTMVGGVGAIGFFVVHSEQTELEEDRFAEAQKQYEAGNFGDAARLFHFLELDFPESPHRSKYHFMSQLSSARQPLYTTHTDVKDLKRALVAFLEFIADNRDDELFVEYHPDIWDTLHKAASDMASAASDQIAGDVEDAQELAGTADALLEQMEKYSPPKNIDSAGRISAVKSALGKVNSELASVKHRLELIDILQLMTKNPAGNVVKRSHDLVHEYAATQPALAGDEEVQQLLKEMPALQRAGVQYVESARPADADAVMPKYESFYHVETTEEGSLALQDQRTITASAKGVLYGLDPAEGNILWARRIGIDSTALPLRLPRGKAHSERLLVISSDRQALTALDATSGNLLWRQPLDGPCLGRPVLIDDRAFVAERDGRVEEIDTATGKRLGFYTVDQPLTGWGSRHPRTSKIHLTAESYCVYELDVEQKKCTRILYSKHPPGSIRQPVIIDLDTRSTQASTDDESGLLILFEAHGADESKIRTYSLPLAEGLQKQVLATKTMPGWLWEAPFQTVEELAMVSDAGQFRSYGIKQPLSHDALLYPRFRRTFVSLRDEAVLPLRSQIVHAGHNSYWLLVHGKLRRIDLGFFRDEGPKLLPVWEPPIGPLGSPLHAGQLRTMPDDDNAMFLVTRRSGSDACLVSALRPPQGGIAWQRSIGIVVQQPFLTVGRKLLAFRQDRTLSIMDMEKKAGTVSSWNNAQSLIEQNIRFNEPWLHWERAGQEASVFLLTGNNQADFPKLTLRRIGLPDNKNGESWKIALRAPLHGTPAISAKAAVLPLENGNLVRYTLGGESKLSLLNWRSEQADEEAFGHVVSMREDDYLVTDGSSGIRHIHWSEGKSEQTKDFLQVGSRITKAPIILAPQKDQPPRIIVTNADDEVLLLQTGPLKVLRKWPRLGTITAGPFLRDGFVGYIVNDQTLVWLDPDQTEPLWQHSTTAPIVGEPNMIDGKLVIADASGNIELRKVRQQDAGSASLRLGVSAVPTAAPVAWGKDHVIMPLSDGTIIRINVASFDEPLKPAPGK